jgi:O-antigen ligase
MQEQWAPLARAQGTFKDPNVLSTFIIAPAIFLIQGFVLGTQKWKILAMAALSIILAALFLAFSRGAWINFIMSAVLLAAITFVIAPSNRLRSRIVLLSIAGTLLIAIMLVFLLSFETTRQIFQDRFSLVKDYDVGEFGRFGRQAISLQYLLERPWGFGPTFFRRIFGQDPHNVYIHAFSSYGWIGGLTYPLLIIATIAAGWKAVATRTPWQNQAIACFSPLIATMFQGIQIDTDHWRHFYLLLGLVWGFYAATVAHGKAQARAQASPQVLQGSPG